MQPALRPMFVPIMNGQQQQQGLHFRPQIRTLNPMLPVAKQQPTVDNKEADVEALEAEAAKWMANKQKKEAEQRQKKLDESKVGISAPPPPPMDSFPAPPPPPPTQEPEFTLPSPPPQPVILNRNENLLESNEYLDEAPTPPPGGCSVMHIEKMKEGRRM